jgi:hypothetical protein
MSLIDEHVRLEGRAHRGNDQHRDLSDIVPGVAVALADAVVVTIPAEERT